jgi:hypothetical protein
VDGGGSQFNEARAATRSQRVEERKRMPFSMRDAVVKEADVKLVDSLVERMKK